MMVCGWIFLSTSFSASRRSSADSTATDVVPSPTSSSWALEMLTKTFAAALSRAIDFNIVAPSFVTMISPVELCLAGGYQRLLRLDMLALCPTEHECKTDEHRKKEQDHALG